MAKRQAATKPQLFKKKEQQGTLFGNQTEDSKPIEKKSPPKGWTGTIDRNRVNMIAKQRLEKGLPTYTRHYNSFTCHICNRTTDHFLEIRDKYCIMCGSFHDEDFIDDKSSDNGS